jgi:hypothetical protein
MLLSATIDDPSEDVREYAGRALKSALPRIRDKMILHSGALALAGSLHRRDAKRRQYAAVLLSWLVPKVTELNTLRAISDRVAEAAQRDPDEKVREYAGRAARHIQQQLQAGDAEAKSSRVSGKQGE